MGGYGAACASDHYVSLGGDLFYLCNARIDYLGLTACVSDKYLIDINIGGIS